MIRAVTVTVAVAVVASACSLEPRCSRHYGETPGGSLEFRSCRDDRDNEGRFAEGLAQMAHVFDAVMAENRLEPMGDRWAFIEFVRERRRVVDGGLAGQWSYAHSSVELFTEDATPLIARTAAAHEYMHAYDEFVNGVSAWEWQELNNDGCHFYLCEQGFSLVAEINQRWIETAWLCDDGGSPVPPSYGGCL